MKILLLLLLMFSPLTFADEMKVIGNFKVPNTMFDRMHWVELESIKEGKIQCIVTVGKMTGGVTCDWPAKPKDESK